ncbi:MAG: aminotransferase class V-fold PLP-dependent enzyme [Gammaproteobacteria bacterium]|nr:aminotransferase class V-fold PLP-dependent enzyme [Gammaproteobacteria bacterium]MDH5802414.1 aminotransferase class V-fold PLP-dependent enzyme [Gammaproteobacteria bacterium]
MHLEDEFLLNQSLIYLNHAAVAPWPERTRKAVCDFAQENLFVGAKNYPRWMETEWELRRKIQTLIHAPNTDDVALLKNTSEALSVVAYGLDWQPGDNVVISDMEFPSNRIVWESLHRYGVQTRYATLSESKDGTDAAQRIIDQCNDNTRLVSISSVQYSNGLKPNLRTIGAHCRQHEILFCVDAIQSVGALQFDVEADHIDFAMADGHKWMLGPEGLAFFYCRESLISQLKLHQFGWHMTEDFLNFDQTQWQAASSARRFECGSPNMLGIHALDASLSLLLQYGLEAVESDVVANSRYAMDFILNSDTLQLLTPEQEHLSGIVSFRHVHANTESVFRHLTDNNVVCAIRGGGIRFSPHFYTPRQALQQALELAAGV